MSSFRAVRVSTERCQQTCDPGEAGYEKQDRIQPSEEDEENEDHRKNGPQVGGDLCSAEPAEIGAQE